MNPGSDPEITVVGIDVGGTRKGFHAVALRNGYFIACRQIHHHSEVLEFCLEHCAQAVAIDCPCGWSATDGSRLAEREMSREGIYCYSTPRREKALLHKFYGWVLNGEKLFCAVREHFPLYNGVERNRTCSIETFPHAVVCALHRCVIPAKPKSETRRAAINLLKLDANPLRNVDFVDAGLCAITADHFVRGRFRSFGSSSEGFIVVPAQV